MRIADRRLHKYSIIRLPKKPKLLKKISEEIGNFETWEKEFRAIGMMRGIGWAVLYRDALTGRLFNFWINEHKVGHPAGGTPLLILDVFEHAFLIDDGLKEGRLHSGFFQEYPLRGRRGEVEVKEGAF